MGLLRSKGPMVFLLGAAMRIKIAAIVLMIETSTTFSKSLGTQCSQGAISGCSSHTTPRSP